MLSRTQVSNTLLPYLTALLEDGKIEPKDALALNRLAEPVEAYLCGTEQFAQAIRDKAGPDPEIITALIRQFEDDNPDTWMDSTAERLTALAKEALGASEMVRHLSAARNRHSIVRHTRNESQNYRVAPDAQRRKSADDIDRNKRVALEQIANDTDPTDETSLIQAISAFNELQNIYGLKDDFFSALRAKLPFSARTEYIRHICALEHFFFYWKLAELKECKQSWAGSSAALDEVYESAAIPLINLHAGDLVHDGRLSGANIKEISDLTGVPVTDLVLELIKAFARPDSSVSGAVWLAFGSFICPLAKEGQGQLALQRLLGGEAAKLADNVVDGTWVDELYPENNASAITAGLVWRVLGSPYAECRWRAAHSIRCFAKFERWEILNSLVRNFSVETAGPFQASELTFYYLHARLWLLIALARIALDHPEEIARYKDELLSIATEDKDPHALMRHFAARALLACVDASKLKLPARTERRLRNVDLSPHPRLKKKIRMGGDFYHGRPDSVSKPKFEFDLDYDFHKLDVDNLSHLFGKPCWEVADMMSDTVHQLDPSITSMYESGAREPRYAHMSNGITTRYHGYGQQLGWHALFLAAGKLLVRVPVTDDWWYEADPWGEWFGRYVLTRDDGLWLSDGTDRKPLDNLSSG